jgi:hypothetical protein
MVTSRVIPGLVVATIALQNERGTTTEPPTPSSLLVIVEGCCVNVSGTKIAAKSCSTAQVAV